MRRAFFLSTFLLLLVSGWAASDIPVAPARIQEVISEEQLAPAEAVQNPDSQEVKYPTSSYELASNAQSRTSPDSQADASAPPLFIRDSHIPEPVPQPLNPYYLLPEEGEVWPTPTSEPTPPPEPVAVTPEFRQKPLYRLPVEAPEVVLTFDDGPSAYLDAILDILAEEQVPAVFFFISGRPDAAVHVERVVAEGHQIGSHSVTHRKLTALAADAKRWEIAESQAVLSQGLFDHVRYFRPPYGSRDAEVDAIAQELGMQVVLWDIDSRDWELADTPERIIENVITRVRPGSIILLHERKQTVEVLPALIAELRSAGYQFRLLP